MGKTYKLLSNCKRFLNLDIWFVVQAMKMIQEIKDAFMQNLPKLGWMDPETRKSAEVKAKAVIDMIGFPKYILNKTALDERYEKVGIFIIVSLSCKVYQMWCNRFWEMSQSASSSTKAVSLVILTT